MSVSYVSTTNQVITQTDGFDTLPKQETTKSEFKGYLLLPPTSAGVTVCKGFYHCDTTNRQFTQPRIHIIV